MDATKKNEELEVNPSERRSYQAPDIDSMDHQLMDQLLGTDSCGTATEAGEGSDCTLN